MKRLLAVFVVAAALGAGFFVGLTSRQQFFAPAQPPGGALEQLLWETREELRARYYAPDELDDDALLYGAIRGLVEAAGDPYTAFFTPEEARQFIEETRGHFEGIGAEIGIRDRVLTVIAPLSGTPAERAGIRAGDRILEIDGRGTERMTLEEAVSRIRGDAGTNVTLRVLSDGAEESRDIVIVRARVDIPSVEIERRPDGIAVIRLFNFSEDATQRVREAMQALVRDPPSGIVLDLRNNPGGFLDAAVDIAGWFLPRDTAVVIERQRREADRTLRARGSGALANVPIAVLVNQGTASAGEILAGALRDNREAPLLGETTFGKGTIQELPRLSGGAALKVTIGEWLTPKGVSLRESGLEPTTAVEDDPETEADEVLERGAALLLEH